MAWHFRNSPSTFLFPFSLPVPTSPNGLELRTAGLNLQQQITYFQNFYFVCTFVLLRLLFQMKIL